MGRSTFAYVNLLARASQVLAATRTKADYQRWRDQRDWTAWKDRMHDARVPLPTERLEGIARCFCRRRVANATIDAHVLAAHRAVGAWLAGADVLVYSMSASLPKRRSCRTAVG